MSWWSCNDWIAAEQTIKALNYWNVMETRDSIGMPVDLDVDINAPPAPWTCKKDVLAYVSALLDSASTAFGSASAAFPVTLPSGYKAVAGTPAGFNKFNRGLKAKVELYRALSHPADAPAAGLEAAAVITTSAPRPSVWSRTAAIGSVLEPSISASGWTREASPRRDGLTSISIT